ncbi:hypothetical protein ATCC90586_001682 [Pythium insidiosum]|nr:hypothetical protein ATCC90586_001682 [Pythium insidiosum]
MPRRRRADDDGINAGIFKHFIDICCPSGDVELGGNLFRGLLNRGTHHSHNGASTNEALGMHLANAACPEDPDSHPLLRRASQHLAALDGLSCKAHRAHAASRPSLEMLQRRASGREEASGAFCRVPSNGPSGSSSRVWLNGIDLLGGVSRETIAHVEPTNESWALDMAIDVLDAIASDCETSNESFRRREHVLAQHRRNLDADLPALEQQRLAHLEHLHSTAARDQAVHTLKTEYELKIARHHLEKQKLRDKFP